MRSFSSRSNGVVDRSSSRRGLSSASMAVVACIAAGAGVWAVMNAPAPEAPLTTSNRSLARANGSAAAASFTAKTFNIAYAQGPKNGSATPSAFTAKAFEVAYAQMQPLMEPGFSLGVPAKPIAQSAPMPASFKWGAAEPVKAKRESSPDRSRFVRRDGRGSGRRRRPRGSGSRDRGRQGRAAAVAPSVRVPVAVRRRADRASPWRAPPSRWAPRRSRRPPRRTSATSSRSSSARGPKQNNGPQLAYAAPQDELLMRGPLQR